MVRGDGEQPGILEWSRELFRVASFHRRLHQVPVAGVPLQKKYPRAVRHDAAPLINATVVRNPIHALHARPGDWIHDKKKQPRSEENAGSQQQEVKPLLGALNPLLVPTGFSDAQTIWKVRVQTEADLYGCLCALHPPSGSQ